MTKSAFQLTRSRGAWLFPLLILRWIVGISTHTLTWSVTQQFWFYEIKNAFQLTRSRGAWRELHSRLLWLVQFQLTRSRGAWPTIRKSSSIPINFNSHAHVERDGLDKALKETNKKFQLTRSRGAWRVSFETFQLKGQISTHTLTWSVTGRFSVTEMKTGISTHTLTWSVTKFMQVTYYPEVISTHTLTWSVTLRQRYHERKWNPISTHTLTWSVT